MIHGFTEDTGELDWPVICRFSFVFLKRGRGQVWAFFHSAAPVPLSSEV